MVAPTRRGPGVGSPGAHETSRRQAVDPRGTLAVGCDSDGAKYDIEELLGWLLELELPAEALCCPDRYVALGELLLRHRGGRKLVVQAVVAPAEADDASRWGW